jgi:hypothetical protein
MSALRVACRTPWGEEHDLVILRGHVIVPRYLGHDRSLWWLGGEHHPQLAVTYLSVLEQETGAELGLSPYCVRVERWNEAARTESWLPVIPASTAAGSFARRARITVVPTSPALESLPIPRRPAGPVDLDLDLNADPRHLAPGERLRAGSHAVSRLCSGLRQLVVLGLLGAAILACVYYLVAAALWLWSLRSGMTEGKIQDGVVLLVVALLFSAVTALFRRRVWTPSGGPVLPDRYDARVRQPVLYALLDAYRLGVALQFLAFAGFIVW